jgi:hypothetical protein
MIRLAAALFILALSTSAEAHRGHHNGWVYRSITGQSYKGKHRAHIRHTPNHHGRHLSVGLVTVQTVANIPITVASYLATRFQSLVADLSYAGYHPKRISCFATSGHVPHSRHYAGAACDFDGSLSRSKFMRSSVADKLIRKNKLRNGCSFRVHGVRDCGHVDDGLVHRHRRQAW